MHFEFVHYIRLVVSEDGVFKFGKDRLRKIPKEESWINGNADNGIDGERQSQCELYYDRKTSLCLYVILNCDTKGACIKQKAMVINNFNSTVWSLNIWVWTK